MQEPVAAPLHMNREVMMERTLNTRGPSHTERGIGTANGFLAVTLGLILLAGGGALLWQALAHGFPAWGTLALGIVVMILGVLSLASLYTLQPNEAAILQLFGAYQGTTRTPGLRAANPFFSRKKISLRARNLNGDKLKVNDKRGNPIEIAAVVVWHVEDSAKAAFDVDDYEMFVKVQSESAVRHLASSFAYDAEENLDVAREPTLLESADVVARALVIELQARLAQAGVVVEEARLTHLAYAPEIAQVMLRRQQAEAIIAARQKIVHGAVSMVQMALNELSAKKVVELDDERRASMVSNLLVVLCAESEVQPVINTGTLYS
jgi:regulator of protease activity HflC (stomatin/prohibitin superfamily)